MNQPEPIPSQAAWELEYDSPKLLTADDEPTAQFREFVRWLAKDQSRDLAGADVLDVGCGTGRNLGYVAESFRLQSAVGIDIANNALRLARERFPGATWIQADLAQGLPPQLEIAEFDLIIDSTTTHLLGPAERTQLIQQLTERLRPGGYYYLRTLTKDGDRNAHNLLKHMPGPVVDSYVHPQLGVVEHVPTTAEIVALYESDFVIHYQKKYTGYQRAGNQSYKRRYLALYLERKVG